MVPGGLRHTALVFLAVTGGMVILFTCGYLLSKIKLVDKWWSRLTWQQIYLMGPFEPVTLLFYAVTGGIIWLYVSALLLFW